VTKKQAVVMADQMLLSLETLAGALESFIEDYHSQTEKVQEMVGLLSEEKKAALERATDKVSEAVDILFG